MPRLKRLLLAGLMAALSACTELRPPDELYDGGGPEADAGLDGGATVDAGLADSGAADTGPRDGGPAALRSGQVTTVGGASGTGTLRLRSHGVEAVGRGCSASGVCATGSIGP
jgi:hypothetical protein